jgi:hypothetical protein
MTRETKYYKMTVVWHGGFTHHIPVADYNLKSWSKFQHSLASPTGVKSHSFKEISYKEHYKMVWGEYPAEPKVKRTRKKTLDINA